MCTDKEAHTRKALDRAEDDRGACRRVFTHAYRHVYGRVCRHVYRHVYGRVCRHVYRHVYRQRGVHEEPLMAQKVVGVHADMRMDMCTRSCTVTSLQV